MGHVVIFVPPLLMLIAAEIAAIRRSRPAPASGPAVRPVPEWV